MLFMQQQPPSIYLPKQKKVLQEQNKFARSGKKNTKSYFFILHPDYSKQKDQRSVN